MKKINVAILGAGFISDIHVESYQRFVPEAEIVGQGRKLTFRISQ